MFGTFADNNFAAAGGGGSPFSPTEESTLKMMSGWVPPTAFRSVIGPVNDPTPYAAYLTTHTFVVGLAPSIPAWAGKADYLANWDGTAWQFTYPSEGVYVWSLTGSQFYLFGTGGTWDAVFNEQQIASLKVINEWAPSTSFRSVIGPVNDPTAYGAYFNTHTFIVGLVPAIPAWVGQASYLANWDGTQWVFTSPSDGMLIWSIDQQKFGIFLTTWQPWLPSTTTPSALAQSAAVGTSAYPAAADHVHSNVAGSNGAFFGSTTTRWNHRVGGLDTSQVTQAGGTLTIGTLASGDTTNVIWAITAPGAVTINLPTATERRNMLLQFSISGLNNITIVRNGSDTINNAGANLTISGVSTSHRHITCNGSGGWFIS